MVDVFISYKKEDRSIVQRVSSGLEAAGLKTWWDDRIDPVEQWERDILKALKSSRSVLVLWTPRSLQSEWVKREARYGAKRRKLVQALMVQCDVPEEFKRFQIADVTAWNEGTAHPGWIKLLETLRARKPRSVFAFWPNHDAHKPDKRHWRGRVLKASEAGSLSPPGTVFSDTPTSPRMVVVPAGRFLMGSPADEEARYSGREDPQHEVTVHSAFAMGRFPVTVGEFSEFVAATGFREDRARLYWDGLRWSEETKLFDGKKWHEPGSGTWRSNPLLQTDRHPVVLVSWHGAVAYTEWLSKVTNARYRLPSEAEWEYSCRASTVTPFHFGKAITTSQANFHGDNVYGGVLGGLNREKTVEVDALPANPWGLFQMHGNVWEWVQDEYLPYTPEPTDTAARVQGKSAYRVMRGGSFTDAPRNLRSAVRGWQLPEISSYSVGFRIARDL